MRQVAQSLGAGVLLQLCLFGSGLTIARRLGPTGRGDVTVVLTLPLVVMQLVCVGFPSALTYFIARGPDAWTLLARRVVFAALSQMVVGLLILFALTTYFLAGKSASTYAAGLVALISLPLLIFLYYVVHLVQGLGDIRWFNILRVGSVVLYSGGIFAGSLLGLTVLRCAIIWTTSQALLASIAAIDLLRRARRRSASLAHRDEVPSARMIAKFAIAGFLAQVSPIESFRLDTLAVAALFPSRIVGYYAVANSVTNPPLFAADAVVAAGYPHVAAQDGEAAIVSTKRYMTLGAILCGSSALLLAASLPFLIPVLFGRAYLPSVTIGELLACAAALLGIRRIGNDFLRALGRPGLSTGLEFITLCALAVGVAVLGSSGGGRGVALALILSTGLGLVLFWRLLRRHQLLRKRDVPSAGRRSDGDVTQG